MGLLFDDHTLRCFFFFVTSGHSSFFSGVSRSFVLTMHIASAAVVIILIFPDKTSFCLNIPLATFSTHCAVKTYAATIMLKECGISHNIIIHNQGLYICILLTGDILRTLLRLIQTYVTDIFNTFIMGRRGSASLHLMLAFQMWVRNMSRERMKMLESGDFVSEIYNVQLLI